MLAAKYMCLLVKVNFNHKLQADGSTRTQATKSARIELKQKLHEVRRTGDALVRRIFSPEAKSVSKKNLLNYRIHSPITWILEISYR